MLIQVDGKFPNLALMKLSTWHKELGDTVFLNNPCNPDRVYVSCVFSWNRPMALSIANFYRSLHKVVEIGGSGVSLFYKLPENVEHKKPDYSLYNIDFSMGFTSRGCIRHCPFCIVPIAEGRIQDHASITEFWEEDHEKIILLDNNFLASPKWKENLEFLIQHDLKVSFTQGLDIRLINQENAQLLSESRYYNWKFSRRRLYFAWDLMNYEQEVIQGIRTLQDYGISKKHLMFYVLVGFSTTFEQDLYRVEKLMESGVKPFIMPYNHARHPLTRWINNYKLYALFKKQGVEVLR